MSLMTLMGLLPMLQQLQLIGLRPPQHLWTSEMLPLLQAWMGRLRASQRRRMARLLPPQQLLMMSASSPCLPTCRTSPLPPQHTLQRAEQTRPLQPLAPRPLRKRTAGIHQMSQPITCRPPAQHLRQKATGRQPLLTSKVRQAASQRLHRQAAGRRQAAPKTCLPAPALQHQRKADRQQLVDKVCVPATQQLHTRAAAATGDLAR